jgi:hypothetical protein
VVMVEFEDPCVVVVPSVAAVVVVVAEQDG